MSLTGRARPHTVTRNASFALRPQRVSAPPLVSSGVWRVRVCACARHRHALPTRQAITKKKTLQTPFSVLSAHLPNRRPDCEGDLAFALQSRGLWTGQPFSSSSTDSSRGSHVTAANGLGRREGPSRPPMEMVPARARPTSGPDLPPRPRRVLLQPCPRAGPEAPRPLQKGADADAGLDRARLRPRGLRGRSALCPPPNIRLSPHTSFLSYQKAWGGKG